MRVTFILPGYPYDPVGGYRVVYQYANYLTSQKHAVTVVHAAHAELPPLPKSLKRTRVRWRSILNWKNATWPPRVRWQPIDPGVQFIYLRGLPVEDQIPDGDAVFATAWSTAEHVAGYGPTKGLGFYLLQSWENWTAGEERVEATWRLPLQKVVVSQWLLEQGRRLGVTGIRYIPNAIDHLRFHVSNPPLERPASVVTLHHHAAFKGGADALEALRMLHASRPEIPVTMFGALAPGPELPKWIRYYRNPSQDALARDIYNRNSIYLGASWIEGWGLPPAEAMACGCSFVGTDIGGFREYARDGETALLSPPKDPAALYRNLMRVIQDETLRHRLQTRGGEVIRSFSWEASGRQLETYIQECISRQAEMRSRA